MDIFHITKSKTRQKLFSVFLENPAKDFYLRQLERETGVSAGNLRRDLSGLTKLGLFKTYKQGKNIYYHINQSSPYYKIVDQKSPHRDIFELAAAWVKNNKASSIPQDYYCTTRDIFQGRLESQLSRWESQTGQDAYLLTAIIGEIGNNSYDHNLGNWPDAPGVFFASDPNKKIVVLADRGQGILKTIKYVKPSVANHQQALKVAFTEILSGRRGEHRGNGLKFVKKVILEKKWALEFSSGDAKVEINPVKNADELILRKQHTSTQGCLAVIKY